MATRATSLKVRLAAGITAVLMLAGLVLAVLPSGDSQSADTTTTTIPPPTSAPPATTAPGPPTTLGDQDYLRFVSGIGDLVDAADGQRCPLISAYDGFGELPTPGNPAQVRAAVEVTSRLLRATAASMSEDEVQAAAAIASSASALEAEAEAKQYAPEWINTPPGSAALADAGFSTAIEAYQRRTEQLCLPDTGDGPGATDAPG